jgi:hypothetical protein
MKKLIFPILLLFPFTSSFSQLTYNPFEYDFSEKIETIEGKIAADNEEAVYIFNKSMIWYGLLPNTQYNIRAVIIHKLVYLNSEKSIDDNNKIYISNSSSDSLHAFKVRIIDNGKIVREFGKSDLKESKESQDSKLRMLAVEGLKKGQMLERLTIELQRFNDNGSVTLEDNYPSLSRYVSIACPSHLKFTAKSYGITQELKDTLEEYSNFRYLYADFGKVLPFESEEYAFKNTRSARVEFTLSQNFSSSTKLNSWANKGRGLMESLVNTEKSEKKFIDKLVLKQNWNKLNGKEQLYEIETYMKNNINISEEYPYIGNVEKLFSQKYADVYSVLRIYIMIFQSLDIKWQLAVTVPRTKKFFDQNFPSSAYITIPLFYLTDLKSFMDPSDYEYRGGDISYTYEGQKAMFIKPMLIGEGISGVTRIDSIPDRHRSLSVRNIDIKVNWDEDMNSIIQTHYIGTGHGIDSRKLIYTLNDKDKANEFTEESVRDDKKEGDFKIIEVNHYDLNKYSEYVQPIEMKYQWTTEEFSESVGNNILFKYGLLIGRQVELYKEKERKYPIDNYFPHDHKVILEINIPEGYKAKGFEGKNKHLEYKDSSGNELFGIDIQVNEKDGKIILEIFEYYARSVYPPSEFEHFREVINAAADVNAYTLLLEKK